MNGLRFQDPLWIAVLLPLLLVMVWADRQRLRFAVLYSSVEGLRSLPVTWALRLKRLLPWVRFLGLALLVVSLARPQQGREEFRIRTEGIAIEMAIDRSGSMQALDFEEAGKRVSRLDQVKRVFHDFVAGNGTLPGRPDDLIGLVAFGGFAEGKCPLTLDHGALLQILDSIEIPKPLRDSRGRVINQDYFQEEMATAIGDALALGVDRLKDAQAKSKVLILLSDGESNAGIVDPLDGAKAAKAFGIKVYTIGVGTTGVAPFPREDAFGRPMIIPQQVRLDEETLKKIAETTEGRYFNAQTTSSLEDVYAIIDKLEKTQTEGHLYTEYRELYLRTLLPGIVLLLVELVLSSTRFLSLP